MVATIQVGQPKIEIEKKMVFMPPKVSPSPKKSSVCLTEKLSQKVCKNG